MDYYYKNCYNKYILNKGFIIINASDSPNRLDAPQPDIGKTLSYEMDTTVKKIQILGRMLFRMIATARRTMCAALRGFYHNTFKLTTFRTYNDSEMKCEILMNGNVGLFKNLKFTTRGTEDKEIACMYLENLKANFIDHLNEGKPITLFGHSMGGQVAAYLKKAIYDDQELTMYSMGDEKIQVIAISTPIGGAPFFKLFNEDKANTTHKNFYPGQKDKTKELYTNIDHWFIGTSDNILCLSHAQHKVLRADPKVTLTNDGHTGILANETTTAMIAEKIVSKNNNEGTLYFGIHGLNANPGQTNLVGQKVRNILEEKKCEIEMESCPDGL